MGPAAIPIITAVAPIILGAIANKYGGGGGGGKEGGVPGEFESLLGLQTEGLRGSMEMGGKFAEQLPIGANVSSPKQQGMSLGQRDMAQTEFGGIVGAQGPGTFEDALASLRTGIGEGFTGDIGETVSGLTADFEAALRPAGQRQFEIGSADVFEQAAAAGQTRSSTTVDALSRLQEGISTNITAQVGAAGADLTSQMAGQQATGRQAATMAGTQIPGKSQAFLNQPVAQNLQTLFQGLQLPISAMGAAGGAGAIPYQPAGNKGGDLLQFGAPIAAASVGNKGGGGGSGGGGK
jgi:hypothetical protein